MPASALAARRACTTAVLLFEQAKYRGVAAVVLRLCFAKLLIPTPVPKYRQYTAQREETQCHTAHPQKVWQQPCRPHILASTEVVDESLLPVGLFDS